MNEEKESELCPCPFCGGISPLLCVLHNGWNVALEQSPEEHKRFFVHCRGCGAHGPIMFGEGDEKQNSAKRAWNNRCESLKAVIMPAQKEIERLRKRLGMIENPYRCSDCVYFQPQVTPNRCAVEHTDVEAHADQAICGWFCFNEKEETK